VHKMFSFARFSHRQTVVYDMHQHDFVTVVCLIWICLVNYHIIFLLFLQKQYSFI